MQPQFGNSSCSVTLCTSQFGLSPGEHTWLEGVPAEESKQHSQAPCCTKHFSKGLHRPPRRAEGEQKAAQAVEVRQTFGREEPEANWTLAVGKLFRDAMIAGLGAQGSHRGASTTEAVPTSAPGTASRRHGAQRCHPTPPPLGLGNPRLVGVTASNSGTAPRAGSCDNGVRREEITARGGAALLPPPGLRKSGPTRAERRAR